MVSHHIMVTAALSLCAFIAAIIDTLAGGGGLITVPALISAGLPPVVVLGTNRLQALCGELTASIHFLRKRLVKFKDVRLGMLIAAIGSIAGSYVATIINDELLAKALPFLLLAVLIYTIITPSGERIQSKRRLSTVQFYLLFGCIIGFYNGFFGPPTGSFWMFALLCFAGMSIVNATMHAKPLNAIGNIASMLVFSAGGHIDYTIALSMGIAQIAGARLGAHLVIHKGNRLIKPVYITVVSIMILDTFIQTFFPHGF